MVITEQCQFLLGQYYNWIIYRCVIDNHTIIFFLLFTFLLELFSYIRLELIIMILKSCIDGDEILSPYKEMKVQFLQKTIRKNLIVALLKNKTKQNKKHLIHLQIENRGSILWWQSKLVIAKKQKKNTGHVHFPMKCRG